MLPTFCHQKLPLGASHVCICAHSMLAPSTKNTNFTWLLHVPLALPIQKLRRKLCKYDLYVVTLLRKIRGYGFNESQKIYFFISLHCITLHRNLLRVSIKLFKDEIIFSQLDFKFTHTFR